MGELPHFISGVPEATLSPTKINNDPVRINQIIQGNLQMNTSSEIRQTILSIPIGYVFEVTYMNIACVALSIPASAVRMGITSRKKTDGSTGFHDMMHGVQLDHKEHFAQSVALPPFAFMIRDDSDILVEFRVTSGTCIANMEYVLVGNLIRKEEILKKTNIAF